MLVAEAYWDMESELQQQGFDFCYDKRLYDRIVERGRVRRPRTTCGADLGYQSRLLRFLENHDEPRIAVACRTDAERAAAVGHRDAARRDAVARGPVRGPAGAAAGLPGPAA